MTPFEGNLEANTESGDPPEPIFGELVPDLEVPDRFFEDLPEEELAAWEGAHD